MNKRELVDSVAEQQGLTRCAAEQTVDSVLAAIRDGLRRDGEVSLSGFGSWQLRQRAARVVRNPKTGEPMEVAASCAVGFRPARAWRDALAGAVLPD